MKEVDFCVTETIDGGDGLINDDHPGFNDEVYKKRRCEIAEIGNRYFWEARTIFPWAGAVRVYLRVVYESVSWTRETTCSSTPLLRRLLPHLLPHYHPTSYTTVVHLLPISYSYGDRVPDVVYTAEETKVWNAVFTKLQDYHKRWACDEYLRVFPDLAKEAGYGPNQIPQLSAISDYCKSQTGFQLRPVNGLLSARDFLNALAFRTFCSTQYIRHR